MNYSTLRNNVTTILLLSLILISVFVSGRIGEEVKSCEYSDLTTDMMFCHSYCKIDVQWRCEEDGYWSFKASINETQRECFNNCFEELK